MRPAPRSAALSRALGRSPRPLPPHPSRSPTGRGRHKKCDETRLPENRGACRRCFTGSWDCQWPLPPGNKPLRSFVSGSKRAQASTAKGSARKHSAATALGVLDDDGDDDTSRIDPGPLPIPPPSASTSAYLSTFTSCAPASTGHGGSIPVSGAPSPFPFLPSTSASSSSLPISSLLPTASSTAGSSTPNPYADLDVLAPASSFSAFLAPPEQLGDDLSHFFSSLDAEVGYWDSLQAQVRADGTANAAAPDAAPGPSETSAPGSAVEPDSPPVLYAGAGLTPLAEAEAAAQAHRDLEMDRDRVEAEEETVRALLSAASGAGSAPTSAPSSAPPAIEAAAPSFAPLAASTRKEKRPRLQSVPPAPAQDVEPVEVDPICASTPSLFISLLGV